MPKIRVRMATIFAPSWRKRCSTMPDTSGGTWTVFFKSNSDALNSPKIPVFGQQVIPSGARNPQSQLASRKIITTFAHRVRCHISFAMGNLLRLREVPRFDEDDYAISNAFLFQFVNVEPVMHYPVTRNELLNVILHVLLEFQGQVAQMQVAFLVVPGNDFGARTLFSVLADPLGNLIIGCASGDERAKIIIIDLGKFQPGLIERTIGMVLPFPAYEHCATLVHGTRR